MSIRSTRGGGYNRTKKLTRRARLVGLSRSNSRWHLFSTATAMFSVAFLVTFLCSSILAPARNTNAETVTESSSASGYTLSLSATPVVNLNVGVLEVPVMTVGVGTVSTSTTAPGGYKLYLSMAGTSNDLRRTGSDVDTISATTGTMADSSALGIGEWGYAIPSTTPNISATDFDTSYDIMESAYPSSKGFAAPPISTATAQLITSTSTANTLQNNEPVPDEIQVYYGINADNTTTLGTYTNSVLLTAVADAAQTAGATVSPTSASTAGGDTITVASTLFSTSTIDANIYMLTSAAWQDVSANPSHISSYSSMQMSGCTQSSSTPVTYTGCVTPANDEGTGYHVYIDVPKYEKNYTASFTYYVPIPFYQISTMQEMTASVCNSVTAPSSASVVTLAPTQSVYDSATPGSVVPQRTLIDSRGSEPYKSYTIRKLADERCWMIDNLAIENATLNSSNSNLPANKTVSLPASSTASSTSGPGWCTTNSQTCDDQLLTINYVDAGKSSHSEYGNYYNWYTATATYGGYNTTTDTSYSICPKGWRLPKGGSSGEFQTLYGKYNTSALMRDANGPNFIRAGRRSGSSTSNASTVGYYWSSTAYDNNSAYLLSLNSFNVTPANNDRKYFGFTVRCIAENRDLFSISNMQDMNVTICENTTTPTASATASDTNGSHKGDTSYVPTKTLTDSRDSKTYTVKKLADGRCWMTQNLRLVGPISAADLNSTNTDVAPGSTFALPASDSGTWCNSSSTSCRDELRMLDSGNADYGAYYNWRTATAGTGTYELVSADATSSICPKGWKLPTGGESGEFKALRDVYSSSAFGGDWRNAPLNFTLAGYRNGDSTTGITTSGYYWSSTAHHERNTNAEYLVVNPTRANRNIKCYGYSVRCINVN